MPRENWLQFTQEHWLPIATYALSFLATVIPSIGLLHRTGIHLAWAAFNLIPLRRDDSLALGGRIFEMAKARSGRDLEAGQSFVDGRSGYLPLSTTS